MTITRTLAVLFYKAGQFLDDLEQQSYAGHSVR